MHIPGLWLQHFRNFTEQKWFFDRGVNIFTAPNGTGKSNMIEALSLLSTAQSWRAKQTTELIQWGEELARIQTKVVGDGGEEIATAPTPHSTTQTTPPNTSHPTQTPIATTHQTTRLEQMFTTGELQGKRTNKRLYKVNNVNRRAQDAVGHLLTVLFTPEEMDIFQSGPSARRRLLDRLLDQLYPEYRYARHQYEKALKRRNKLLHTLREHRASRADFFIWDRLLCEHGQVIFAWRDRFLHWLNAQPGVIENYQVQYDHSRISESRLAQYASAEVAVGHTLVGPHKDDVTIKLQRGGQWRSVEQFGSRGEQRLALLWWKLAEVEYIEQQRQDTPVLLLDDVFSELDEANQQLILLAAQRAQTIITTVEPGFAPLLAADVNS